MAKTVIYKSEEGKAKITAFYETLLQRWHQPSEQIILETSFGDTFIVESGSKESPAILLLHGSGANSAMWLSDAMVLSAAYHVLAVDIIGECGKSSENRPPFKNGNYAGWIFEITQKLGLERVSVIACSLGGWIALDFSTHHPELTDKLVLIATAGITPLKLKTLFLIIATTFLGTWGFNKLNRLVYGNLSIDNKALEFASLVKKHFKPRTDVLPLLTDESLRQIKAPVLFAGGENDCFYNSQKTANRLKQNLNNVQCMVLKDTGHVVINQSKSILQFLNS